MPKAGRTAGRRRVIAAGSALSLPLLAATMLDAQAVAGACTSPDLAGRVVCTYTVPGTPYDLAVPVGVSTVEIRAYGASGAGNGGLPPTSGGLGGTVWARFPVSSADRLNVRVGGAGTPGGPSGMGLGGANGGGNGGTALSAGGGGASDVRLNGTALGDRILVAGGGGGGGAEDGVIFPYDGGPGGGEFRGQDGGGGGGAEDGVIFPYDGGRGGGEFRGQDGGGGGIDNPGDGGGGQGGGQTAGGAGGAGRTGGHPGGPAP